MKPVQLKDSIYEVVLVNNHTYLFSDIRIDRDTIPDDLVAYDVRDSDDCDGSFAEIQDFVFVNYWGTIIGKHPLPLDSRWNTYYPTEEDGDFVGAMTLREYMRGER